MKKNDIMMYAAIAAGGYLLYWYLTKNGPNGAAFDSQGRQVGLSYWDSWFGGGVSAPAGTIVQTPTGQTVVVQSTPANTTPTPANTGTDVRSRLLTASGGQNNLTADQWNYYRNALFPPALTPEQFGRAFPVRTDPMPALTVDQFLAAVSAAGINASTGLGGIRGLGDQVPVPARASIPSMSFGGSLAQAVPGSPSAFRGTGIRGRGQGGGYLQ